MMIGNDVFDDLSSKKLGIKTYLITNHLLNKHNQEIDTDYEGTYYDYNPYTDTYGSKHTLYDDPNLIYEYVFDFYNNILEVNVDSNPYPGLFMDRSGVIGTSSIFFGSM